MRFKGLYVGSLCSIGFLALALLRGW